MTDTNNRINYRSWDFPIVSAFVGRYLQDRAYPGTTSSTNIQDLFLAENAGLRISRLEQDISRALNDFGYRRVSVKGAGFVRVSLGILTVPDPAQCRELGAMAF